MRLPQISISSLALTAVLCSLELAQPLAALALQPRTVVDWKGSGQPGLVNIQPPASVVPYVVPSRDEPLLTPAQKLALLRRHIRYVFVLYQENRSFDSLLGTYPGADGLYSQPPSRTLGFNQQIVLLNGTTTTIQPFLIGPAQYAADTDDIDHSHALTVQKMDVVGTHPRMDRFSITEELKYSPSGNPSLKALQYGELAMAHEDCNTVPILWNYAARFTLFDHIFEDIAGPSTPGNLSIIAAQTGLTQWVLHPNLAFTGNGNSGPGEPVVNDTDPLWGSPNDPNPPSQRLPVNPGDFTGSGPFTTQYNQTYASLPLTLQGGSLGSVAQQDTMPSTDLADVGQDVKAITARGGRTVQWGWYEEGFDREPTDLGPAVQGTHASYVTHHNGPQYFGYIANNPSLRAHLHGLNDFFTALQQRSLPPAGGVFYVKGGFENIFGLTPTNPDPNVQKNFLGDDDHPAYSDAQISDVLLARAVNAIAQSPYWKHSVIIITFDDSEGDYDHVPPPVLSHGPDGSVVSDGPRVPLILISPYSQVHAVVSSAGSQASVVKFVDALFNLPPLAKLPDELEGRRRGRIEFHMSGLGPQDALTPDVTDLLGAFDNARLNGNAAPLPASYAEVPTSWLTSLPAQNGASCAAIGIVPVDQQLGIVNHIPANFNPRPSTDPSTTPVSTTTP